MSKFFNRKSLSVLLAVLMIFSLVPAFNLAVGADSTDYYLYASPYRCWLSGGVLSDAELASQQSIWDANPKGETIASKITSASFLHSTYTQDGSFWLNLSNSAGVANQMVIDLDLPDDATKFELLPGWGLYKNCTITASKDGTNWYMVGRVLEEMSAGSTVFSSSQLSAEQIANNFAYLLADNPEKKIKLRYHLDDTPCSNGKVQICNIGYRVYKNTSETYTTPKAYTGDTSNTAFDDAITADYPPVTEHIFTSQYVSNDYLKSAATCTESAVYYYSCANCPAKGSETFVSGDPLGHEMHSVGGIAPSTGEGYDNYQQCTRCEVNDKKLYYTARLDVSPYTTGEDASMDLTDIAAQDTYWNGLVADSSRVDLNLADYIVNGDTTYTKTTNGYGSNWINVYGQLTIDIDLPNNTSRFDLQSGWGIYANCKILASNDGGSTWYIVGRVKNEQSAGATVYYSDQLSQAEIANTYAFLLTNNPEKQLRFKFIPDDYCNDGRISIANVIYRAYLGEGIEYPSNYTAPVVYNEGSYPTALAHNVVVDDAVAPTFTATGLTEGSHCSLCGEVFVAQTEIPMKKAAVINTTTNTNYEDFASALNAAKSGDVIKLLVNIDDTAVATTVISAGITLDLNGFKLNTFSLSSFGNIIDTSENSVGGIYSVGSVIFQPENSYMPILDSAKGCYRLFEFSVSTYGTKYDSNKGALKFGFEIKFYSKEAYEIIAANPSSMQFVSVLKIEGNSTEYNDITYICDEAAIVKYANTVLANYDNFQNGYSIALVLTVFGVSNLDENTTISATPTLTSLDTNVAKTGNTKKYTF